MRRRCQARAVFILEMALRWPSSACFPSRSLRPLGFRCFKRLLSAAPEVNDVLVDMVDALDELDTHIVKGDHDHRDPVVVARRAVRPP